MTNPTILAISPACPWPIRDGFSLRATRLLEELRASWDIELLCDAPSPKAPAIPGVRVTPVVLDGPVRGVPWGFTSHRLVEAAVDRMKARSFDAALLWGGAELVLPQLTTTTVVIDRVDCGWLTVWRDARRSSSLGGMTRQAYWASLTAHYERWFAATGNQVVVVADSDATAVRRLARTASVGVIPNGVDMPCFPATPRRRAEPTVTFTGVMSFAPNRDAADWFVRNCWQVVRAAIPSARFRIVGRYPDDGIRALAMQPGVDVIGEVPSVAEELASSWVAVAPMQSGAGIKNKVLEAWATATPVVMTSLATGGLVIPPEHAAFVVDHARAFAMRVIELLHDQGLASALGHSAKLSAQLASWSRAAELMNHLLQSATRKPTTAYRPPFALRRVGMHVAPA